MGMHVRMCICSAIHDTRLRARGPCQCIRVQRCARMRSRAVVHALPTASRALAALRVCALTGVDSRVCAFLGVFVFVFVYVFVFVFVFVFVVPYT